MIYRAFLILIVVAFPVVIWLAPTIMDQPPMPDEGVYLAHFWAMQIAISLVLGALWPATFTTKSLQRLIIEGVALGLAGSAIAGWLVRPGDLILVMLLAFCGALPFSIGGLAMSSILRRASMKKPI